MKKDKFNAKFRECAKTLSPKPEEQDLIAKIYQSFNDLFGINNCIQIGSYPRFTSITPIHDLDILYILGSWDENNHAPSTILKNLFNQLKSDYTNPTSYLNNISLQTHSVTIEFLQDSKIILSVDIVPAYSYSQNEFSQDIYMVPEVIKERDHIIRNSMNWDSNNQYAWIQSDPRGYIKIATDAGNNSDFRKTVKFVKKWKSNLSKADSDLKLKSFHIEQVIINFFQLDPSIDIFDAIFSFFTDLPRIIDRPNQIRDRANGDKYIDDYLIRLTPQQKEKIKHARDGFLVKLENMKESNLIDDLLNIDFYLRALTEKFLFDSNIKTFIDSDLLFKIDGFVKPLEGFSSGWLTQTPQLQGGLTRGRNKRKIAFSIRNDIASANEYLWKVKNDDSCEECRRGEITRGQTRNNPETTEYIGNHHVECYAIDNGICIARSKVPVKII